MNIDQLSKISLKLFTAFDTLLSMSLDWTAVISRV